jgi:NhaP-type Na+/H+ or K+/H+ antiporter
MSSAQISLGVGLMLALAVACQVVASRWHLPAIILLLPVGFAAGSLIPAVDPNKIFGAAFSPLVSLGVAVILFDGGLDLDFHRLEGHEHAVLRRLIYLGVPITALSAAGLAWLLFGHTWPFAFMLGAILIVSGPTVVTPILEAARPVPRVRQILTWEGLTIDPLGAVIGALAFHAIAAGEAVRAGQAVGQFALSLLVGLAGAAAGTLILWVLFRWFHVTGVLATESILATVILVAAACNALRDETGVVAAILMGVAAANLRSVDVPEERPFLKTMVQLIIGLLFISISATVTPASLGDVVWSSLALIAALVLLVRPLVALAGTAFSPLSRRERAFISWMDPRGIVAASTAAVFAAPLATAGVAGAQHLLPVTFLVIVGTVALYGLSAPAVCGLLGLRTEPEVRDAQRASASIPNAPRRTP